MESFEQGPFKTTSMSGRNGAFNVKWFPPEAAKRLAIKCTGGKCSGVGGLELDEDSYFGVFDSDGREVVSFWDSYFETATTTIDQRIQEVLVLEADRTLVVRRINGTEERLSFKSRPE